MKSLVKLLAVFTLIVVMVATLRSLGKQAKGAYSVASCDYLSVSPNSGASPLNTILTISAHTTDGTPIRYYVFNFGDGSPTVTQTTNSITHPYSQVGNPTAVASVIDQNGNVSTSPACQKTVTVISNVVCDSLTGQALDRGGPPVTITFSLSGHSNGSSITTYRFDFGDGSPSVDSGSSQASHRYTSSGKFVARGYVVDATGNVSPDTGSCTLNINIPPPGTLCLNWANGLCQATSSRTLPANQDPDINIILRQFISVPGTLDIVDFVHDVAPAPQLCDLFPSNAITIGGQSYKTAFTALYGVGIIGGVDATGKVEQNPPHMAGFQVKPGESIYAPPLTYYGSVGDGYDAILLYADDNSVVLKYTLDDDVIRGYTLHILGIKPDPAILNLYNQSNSDDRWYLPGVNGDQVLGTAKSNEVWVSIRDTGQFMDPRWERDWWNTCSGQVAHQDDLTSVTRPPGYTTTVATPISTGGPLTTLLGIQATPPAFPPLGSLENCPGEIPTPQNNLGAACVPTNSPGQPCVSECSEPLQVTENLRMFADQGCLRNGDCLAKIAIDANKLSIPFVQQLGDYFAGVLDAEHPDDLQAILKAGATDPSTYMNMLFQKAGVNRKLLPQDIQDQLKCQFIAYVRSKKIPNSDSSYPNTKYLGHTYDSTTKVEKLDGTEFMVLGKKITDIKCPPNVDPSDGYTSQAAWEKDWATVWLGVPLFADDDTQGKIEFVSPSLFTSRERNNDSDYPKNELGPFYISVPGVAKLASATGTLQRALIPQPALVARAQAIISDPATALPTYGQTIDLSTPIAACRSTNWSQYYTPDEQHRAVSCNLTATDSGELQKICVVGPDAQIRCYQQAPGTAPSAGVLSNPQVLVQVRTIIPNLFEIAENTIDPATGFLRIFKQQNIDTLNQINGNPSNPNIPSQDVFEKAYAPDAASGGAVKYFASDRDITINDQDHPNGWQIFFYRLGGLWNARNFVLDLLNPKPASSTTHGQTP